MNNNFDELTDILQSEDSELNNIEFEFDLMKAAFQIDSYKVEKGVVKSKKMITKELPGKDKELKIQREEP